MTAAILIGWFVLIAVSYRAGIYVLGRLGLL